MANKKSNNTKWLIIGLLGIIIVISLIFIISKSITGNVVDSQNTQSNQNEQSQKSCIDVQVPYEEPVTENKIVQYTERECETKDLIYSVINERWDYSTCNDWNTVCYEEGWFSCKNETTFCADKSLSYSVDLNNLDEEQGVWTVDILFYKDGRTIYTTKTITQSLYPKTTKTFTGFVRVTGDGPNGDANLGYGATYSVKSIPTKQVCRDVIKYKEVPETRTITKYKTEQKCD